MWKIGAIIGIFIIIILTVLIIYNIIENYPNDSTKLKKSNNEIVIGFKLNVPESEIQKIVSGYGIKELKRNKNPKAINIYIRILPSKKPAEIVKNLRKLTEQPNSFILYIDETYAN